MHNSLSSLGFVLVYVEINRYDSLSSEKMHHQLKRSFKEKYFLARYMLKDRLYVHVNFPKYPNNAPKLFPSYKTHKY